MSTTPEFSRSAVDRAGEVLSGKRIAGDDSVSWATEVAANWRSCHLYPINTFQATLRRRVKFVDSSAIVAQRLKRMRSIVEKLNREQGMKLSRMGDIGGLRAVVRDVPKVYELDEEYRLGRLQHRLASRKDYIREPKPSGYRGVHFVYRYRNTRASEYNNLRLELQFRSKMQHAWATAVEVVGFFERQALKAGEGSSKWLQFFKVIGAAFALIEDGYPGDEFADLSEQDMFRLAAQTALQNKVIRKLEALALAPVVVQEAALSAKSTHLLLLDIDESKVTVQSYGKNEETEANRAYFEVEKLIQQADSNLHAVLVGTSTKLLTTAYPNFFLDTQIFVKAVDELIRVHG